MSIKKLLKAPASFQGRTSDYCIDWTFIDRKLMDEILLLLYRHAQNKNKYFGEIKSFFWSRVTKYFILMVPYRTEKLAKLRLEQRRDSLRSKQL